MVNALSQEIPFAVVPQENSIFGNVTETYDLLRLPEMGKVKFVQGEVTLGVRHCLVVRNGVKLEQIQRILSHEQAGALPPFHFARHLSRPPAGVRAMPWFHSQIFAACHIGKDQFHCIGCTTPALSTRGSWRGGGYMLKPVRKLVWWA